MLSRDQASPLAPESDEEKPAEEKKPADSAEKDEPKKPAAVRIDFDNILQRVLSLPMPERRYVGLQVGKAGALYAIEAAGAGPGPSVGLTVHRFDLVKRKADVAATGLPLDDCRCAAGLRSRAGPALERKRAQDGRDRSAGESARRVEAAVPRSAAPGARFLSRPETPRRGRRSPRKRIRAFRIASLPART